jgi:hypothetical protein
MPAAILVSDGFGGSPSAVAKTVTFLQTLSHQGPLQILCLLLGQDLTVGAPAEALGISRPG